MSWRLPATALLAFLAAFAADAAHYRIAPEGSYARFSVRLMWFSRAVGRFDHIDGVLDTLPNGMAKVDAHIDVASVATDADGMRRFMLGEEFFDVARYPVIHFVSSPVPMSTLAGGGPLDGELTLRGVTRPVHFDLRPSDCPQPGVLPCCITVDGRVRRGDFGMTAHRATLADEVHLVLVVTLDPASS